MQARETPNFAGLYKNRNCAFPLSPSMKLFFFFYLRFLSQTQAIHRTASEGRKPSFILYYHLFHLRKIQTFILQLAFKVSIFYFQL